MLVAVEVTFSEIGDYEEVVTVGELGKRRQQRSERRPEYLNDSGNDGDRSRGRGGVAKLRLTRGGGGGGDEERRWIEEKLI